MHSKLISFLVDQHRMALRLLEALVATSERATKSRQQLLEKLESELYHHMLLEEEVFYPALEAAAESKRELRVYRAAREEHESTKSMLKDLGATHPASPEFAKKVKLLKRSVEQHAAEEEATLFSIVPQVFAPDELEAVTRILLRRHRELEAHRAWSEGALAMAFSAPE